MVQLGLSSINFTFVTNEETGEYGDLIIECKDDASTGCLLFDNQQDRVTRRRLHAYLNELGYVMPPAAERDVRFPLRATTWQTAIDEAVHLLAGIMLPIEYRQFWFYPVPPNEKEDLEVDVKLDETDPAHISIEAHFEGQQTEYVERLNESGLCITGAIAEASSLTNSAYKVFLTPEAANDLVPTLSTLVNLHPMLEKDAT